MGPSSLGRAVADAHGALPVLVGGAAIDRLAASFSMTRTRRKVGGRDRQRVVEAHWSDSARRKRVVVGGLVSLRESASFLHAGIREPAGKPLAAVDSALARNHSSPRSGA
jgi:hypothetical protein